MTTFPHYYLFDESAPKRLRGPVYR